MYPLCPLHAPSMALSFHCKASITPPHQVKLSHKGDENLQQVKKMVNSTGIPSLVSSPHHSLQTGNWVKLICGASFEDVVDIRNLSLVYTLAGVDCIDCAADASVVSSVNEGIEAAMRIVSLRRPWVMISVNDDEDLHFRKAEFDPDECPLDCSRPCENVCPANAIQLKNSQKKRTDGNIIDDVLQGGVITERCYGCGRCFPVCPYDKIREVTYVRDATATSELLKRDDVDAIEIHISGRQTHAFKELWHGLGDSVRYLRLIAVSLPNSGDSTLSLMNSMYSIMEPHLGCLNLWQLDGRPMSGDIGRGATRESIAFAVQLAALKDRPPGFLQLAGGTNAHTVEGLKKAGLFRTTPNISIFTTASQSSTFVHSFILLLVKSFLKLIHVYLVDHLEYDSMKTSQPHLSHSLIGGVAYGSYARKIVGRVLRSMQSQFGHACIEDHPTYLENALTEALGLVNTVKYYNPLD